MRKSFPWVALALVGCGPGASAPTPTPSVASAGTLVAFGDSLTAGLGLDENDAYPAQLQRRLEKDGLAWRVVNAGSSGETSTGARSRLAWVMKIHPTAVIVETGANDGLRGVSPDVTEANLRAIVQGFKQQHVRVLLVGMRAEQNMGADYARKFNAVYARVANAEKVPLVPFFLEGVATHPNLNQSDRMHPTAEGYAVVIDHIAPEVEKLLRGSP